MDIEVRKALQFSFSEFVVPYKVIDERPKFCFFQTRYSPRARCPGAFCNGFIDSFVVLWTSAEQDEISNFLSNDKNRRSINILQRSRTERRSNDTFASRHSRVAPSYKFRKKSNFLLSKSGGRSDISDQNTRRCKFCILGFKMFS